MYRRGDLVIYRMQKVSTRPGPRAEAVHPSPHGETYSYLVDKFWVVADVQDDKLLVRTRRGKERLLDAGDPLLRRARWWEKWLYGEKFPSLPDE